jgi:hypothetical protein
MSHDLDRRAHHAAMLIAFADRAPHAFEKFGTETVVFGDLGCPDIDTDEWREQNRVKLFGGKVNRWILARTLRDNPSPSDLEGTLVAVMTKWFDGSPLDPAFSKLLPDGNVAGVTDGIRIVRTSKTPIGFSVPAERRESLTSIPTVNPEGGVVLLEVEFNYRGLPDSLPWPVRTAPGMLGSLTSTVNCPVNADWMLVETAEPVKEAPPKPDLLNALTVAAVDVIATPIQQTVWWLAGLAIVAAGGIYAVRRAAGR